MSCLGRAPSCLWGLEPPGSLCSCDLWGVFRLHGISLTPGGAGDRGQPSRQAAVSMRLTPRKVLGCRGMEPWALIPKLMLLSHFPPYPCQSLRRHTWQAALPAPSARERGLQQGFPEEPPAGRPVSFHPRVGAPGKALPPPGLSFPTHIRKGSSEELSHSSWEPQGSDPREGTLLFDWAAPRPPMSLSAAHKRSRHNQGFC